MLTTKCRSLARVILIQQKMKGRGKGEFYELMVEEWIELEATHT